MIKLGSSLSVKVLDTYSSAQHEYRNISSASNNLFEIPHDGMVTHLIIHFTVINITSISPILTAVNTVFIKTIPVRQHDINIVKLVIQKF
jgi:hypothetical protein